MPPGTIMGPDGQPLKAGTGCACQLAFPAWTTGSLPQSMSNAYARALQVVSIEKAGDEAWAGVAAIDKGDSPTSTR
jgi:hypothetical protein